MARAVARLHLNPGSTAPGITKDAVFRFCYENEIIGVGWSVGPPAKEPFTWPDYLSANKRPLTSQKTLHGLAMGDLVWVKAPSGQHFLTEIVGGWEYRWQPDYVAMDIINIRPVRFVPVKSARVPEGLAESFSLRRTCLRVRSNKELIESTLALWAALEAG